MIVTEEYVVDTKDAPNDSANRVNGLEHGKPVTVIDEVTGEDGKQWYHITYKLKADPNVIKTAYVHVENVLLDKDIPVIANASINSNAVNLRDDIGTDGTLVIQVLNTGDKVELLGQTTRNGEVWYRLRYTKDEVALIGWVKASYVDIDEYVFEPDVEFEEQMRILGFPESYIPYLSYLHAKYPEWQFVPVVTGLDWYEVLREESVSNRNLVLLTTDDAKKSMADSEYNWQTNTWVPRDTGKWCTVHPDYLAYCMDPRNFINETYVFMFEALSYSDSHTLDGVKSIVRNTFLAGEVIDTDGNLLNYAQAFMDIGKLVDVSPYHLAARVRQEHGAGNSVLISGTYPGYEGYFNFFNIGASGSNQQMVIQNGFNEAVTDGWTSRYLALVGGATKVAKNYISKGQDTLYFQKFNVVYKDKLYWHQYMQNVTAHMTEGQSVARGYEDKHQAFVFRIPIYDNMPEEAVEFTAKGNRNNYLSSLEIEGLSLTPNFYGKTTSYSIVVDNAVSTITVKGTPVVDKSTVTGTGTYNLEVGDNTIKVYCKSESGETLAYTINVSRLEAGVEGGDKFEEDTPDVEQPDDTEGSEGSESEGSESEGSESEGTESEGSESEGTEGEGSGSEDTETETEETYEWTS
ncbi:MAG: SH3 domain-containing protein, partial [Agathobacter sp.]|nr:SH3 domain-containing protein [Agathobacter sp.]